MISYFTAIFALTISLADTAPTSSPVFPPRSTSESFRLVANVTSGDLSPSIKDYVLTSYHIGAGQAYAVLTPNISSTTGRIFYQNGTAEDIRYRRSNVLSDGGEPLFPFGIVLNEDQSVSVNAGTGTTGVNLALFPDPISGLSAVGKEGFYACEKTLLYGPAVQVFAKAYEEVTPEGCADVKLLAQCSDSSGAEHPYGATSGCYADVAGIDWSVYSA
ncbi:hypothetical protein BJ875DRAFT_21512 [Amylocarpus encephaloides]|uniref:DUF7907 domain-containing protein n=1 Tax=Amylocarpus encephaloides TaxID=45428 RepID=A0A9P8BZ84_9HELO|nr:hypothetical protein BJ875DRAFT_21512 [Amylocarpus encephaloides]